MTKWFNDFVSNFCLVFASAIASIVIYNELLLKPWARAVQEGNTGYLFVYYDKAVWVFLIFIVILVLASAITKKYSK